MRSEMWWVGGGCEWVGEGGLRGGMGCGGRRGSVGSERRG